MKINYDNTEYLSTDSSDIQEINGMKIRIAQNFKYLWSIIQRNGSSNVDTERWIIESKRILVHLIPFDGAETL